MSKFGDLLREQRNAKNISIKKASVKLLIKKEHLIALEEEDWIDLPEATYVKGYIKSYSQFLGLDQFKMLALYRREFDERKMPVKDQVGNYSKSSIVTPKRLRNSVFALAIISFIAYLIIQYSSVLSSPNLEIASPPDDITVSVPIIEVSGKVESESQIAIDGEFVPIDAEGNFSHFSKLEEGQNIIEIIASKRLSPKTKITRTVRLIK